MKTWYGPPSRGKQNKTKHGENEGNNDGGGGENKDGVQTYKNRLGEKVSYIYIYDIFTQIFFLGGVEKKKLPS